MDVSAGKRGRVWSCKPCGYRGEKLSVTNHVYQHHLSLEDYPFSCRLCQFTAFQRNKFVKHGKWYLEHKMRVADGPEPPVSSYLQMRDNTAMLEELMMVLSVEESVRHWESRRRPSSLPPPDGPPVSLAAPATVPLSVPSLPPVPVFITSSLPSSSLAFPSPAVSLPAVSLPVVSLPAVSLPSSAAIPPQSALDSSLPELLTEEDQQLLDEFFVREPSSTEVEQSRKTESLEREVERQRRVIEEHQATISALRRGRDEAPRSFHDGPGEGEPYNPRPQRSSAPLRRSPRKLQSVVRVVPRPIRPKPQQRPWHRSPLDDLFQPDHPFHRSSKRH